MAGADAAIKFSLVTTKENREIEFVPVEVSRYRLGIHSSEQLEVGKLLTLTVKDTSVRVEIISCGPSPNDPRLTAYQLLTKDKNDNIEKLMDSVATLAVPTRKDEDGDDLRRVTSTIVALRATRFKVDKELLVEVNTFGMKGTYVMRGENISKSGILLAAAASEQVPFTSNTIIEMTVDPKCKWLAAPLKCLGKIVRAPSKIASDPSDRHFGVKIIDMDNNAFTEWARCIEELETRSTRG